MKQKLKQPPTPKAQNNTSDISVVFPDGSFAIANDLYPSILLSERTEVIDISDNFRSCHGKAVDRTLLVKSMSDAEFSRLTNFCARSTGPSEHVLHDTLTLDLKLYNYRIGLCKKLCVSPSHITVMYFAEKVRDFLALGTSNGEPYPRNFLSMFKCRDSHSQDKFMSAIQILFDPADEFDVHEAKTFLRSIAAKLTKNDSRIMSSITFSDDTSHIKDHGIGIKPGAYAMIFTSLLSVLDVAASNGKIGVNLHGDQSTFEVDMFADSPVADHFIGSISDIISLSPYICGSGIYLALASATAADTYMFLRAYCECGRLHFTFGAYTDPYPILEFKYRDPKVRVNNILAAVLDVLLSVEVNSQEEGAQEGE